MAETQVVHELMMGHDRITRVVTTLNNGARTVTESADPRLAALLRAHVASMVRRVGAGDDPGSPMESPALHTIYRNHALIRTRIDTTPRGIAVIQTSDDSVTVVALQRHAAEVDDMVARGMAAMHESMMARMGGGAGRGMGMMHDSAMMASMGGGAGRGMGMMHDSAMMASMGGGAGRGMGMMHDSAMMASMGDDSAGPDSAFAAMQQRGKVAMGVDQYTSTHQFDTRSDGGRIELQRDVDDSAGVAQIRLHLRGIAKAFSEGDFSAPAFVHLQEVPGAKVMAARRALITYTYRDLPRGGEVRMVTKDPEALAAIHDFLAFQGREHHAP